MKSERAIRDELPENVAGVHVERDEETTNTPHSV
jgi:hypothetical protein